MSRFPGNIIKLPNVTPTQSSASGVWSLKDQMVYQRNNLWPFQRDPYFNYTTLLLQGNVPNTTGPQAMNLPLSYNADASTNNFLVTPNGDVGPRPFSPYFGGNYSVLFNGSTTCVQAGVASDWTFLTNTTAAWTIEMWIYPTSTATGILLDNNNYNSASTGFNMSYGSGSIFVQICRSVGSSYVVQFTSASKLTVNAWNNVVITYDQSLSSQNLKFYLNGTGFETANKTGNAPSNSTAPNTLTIGRYSSLTGIGDYFSGYIGNLRISNVVRVPSGLPTQPYANDANTKLLTCQSNRFIDNSSNNYTITTTGSPSITDNSPFVSTDFTTGAGYFNGTTDYLSVPSSTAFGYGTGDFTIECWVYPLASTAQRLVFGGGDLNNLDIGFNPANTFQYYDGTVRDTGVSAASKQWFHFAVSRTSGTTSIYINGTRTNNFPDTSNSSARQYFVAGSNVGGNPFNGYINDVRIIKGQGIYSGTTITIPNAPLTTTGYGNTSQNITGTISLLTLQTRAPSQNINFIDSSPNEFIVTKNGNTTQGTFSPFSPTGWGVYTPGGSGNYFTVGGGMPSGQGTAFTLEVWIYIANLSGVGRTITRGTVNGSSLDLTVDYTDGTLYLGNVNTANITRSNIGAIQTNRWQHIMLTRTTGNIYTIYVDGVGGPPNVFQGGNAYNVSMTANTTIGYNSDTPTYNFFGYMSNFRVTNTLVQSANFTPPTQPLTAIAGTQLLLFQSNRYRDNGPSSYSVTGTSSTSVQAFSPFAPANAVSPLVTGGSGYFDGTTDWLTVPDSPAFTMGSGDFTIESWVYCTASDFSLSRYIIAQRDNSSDTSISFAINFIGGGARKARLLVFNNAGASYEAVCSTDILNLNEWTHIAGVRDGATLRIYINGVQQGTANISTATLVDSSGSVAVGRLGDSNQYYWLGYTSGVRVVKGTCLYPGGSIFTPPTTPPTAIPNTSLLLNFTNGAAVDATGKNVVESVGTVQTSNTQAKWNLLQGGSSVYVNGDGNYLKTPCTPINALTGDFTLEAWVYPMDAGRSADAEKYGTIISIGSTGVSSPELSWFVRIVGGVITEYFININSTTVLQVTGLSVSLNAWHYFAVVRSGTATGNVKLYIDGSLVGTSSSANTSTMNFTSTQTLLVARNANSSSYQNWLKGYFQNIRVSNYARTVTSLPTGPFPIG